MSLKNDLNRILIENALRLNLKSFDSDEKRCIRRLIDTGASLSKNHTERGVFSGISDLYANGDSLYYDATSQLFKSVDRDKLITFGVNFGYNTFNISAKTLSDFAKTKSKFIPWIADMDVTTANELKYRSDTFGNLLKHYTAYGINAFILRFDEGITDEAYFNILSSVREYKYTNFILFLSNDVLSKDLINEMSSLSNLLTVLPFGSSNYIKQLEMVESAGILNASAYKFSNDFSNEFKSLEIFEKISGNRCPVAIVETNSDLSPDDVRLFNSGISTLRENLTSPVFIINLNADIQAINKKIIGKEVGTHINVKA
ncbi:hypothetical protein [Eubacterium ruminantium]|uniref:hypothetical protein n=1 Tax=Eubacterium ruminantium TaxID=42322 RepID=UPI0015692EBC|nr:hypothetical protein [Eubacterium ruminantium]